MNKKIADIIIVVLVVLAAVFGLGVYKFKFSINNKPIVDIGVSGPVEVVK